MIEIIVFLLQWVVAPYLFVGFAVYVGLAFFDLDTDAFQIATRWPVFIYYLILDAVEHWRS